MQKMLERFGVGRRGCHPFFRLPTMHRRLLHIVHRSVALFKLPHRVLLKVPWSHHVFVLCSGDRVAF